MPSVAADYYDGRTAERRTVVISLDEDRILVSGEGVERSAPAAQLHVSRRRGMAPRLLVFEDGAFCEVRDHAGLARILASAGLRNGWSGRVRLRLRGAILVLLLCLLIAAAAYQYGIPWVADRVAQRIPEQTIAVLGSEMLAGLDHMLADPSRLPEGRQRTIRARFDALRTPDGVPVPHRVVFRQSRFFGPNALALPDGTLVLFDDLVKLARHDDELMGVLAHEQGHVRARHALRAALQEAPFELMLAWYSGDASGALAKAPEASVEVRYSQAFESEADGYAAQLLAANGIAPRRLADLLERVGQRSGEPAGLPDYLSTHPGIDERLRALRSAPPALPRP